MSTDRHQHVKDVFFAVSELPEGERAAYLNRACVGDDALREEVLSLLTHDATAEDVFSDNQMAAVRSALEDVVGSTADARSIASGGAPIDTPQSVGRYAILRVIGHGGMGVVYEAQQDNPKRTVAIKVIRPGLATERIMRRFEHEAQVLGRLQHPGIAHIYEAGVEEVVTASGMRSRQPYFAMELIRGKTLIEFVREQERSVCARLALFAEVCDAVDHAHAQGVIHRDLKPSNILIDDAGQPKILDFGVARLTDGDVQATTMQTDVGQLIGTLPYMSPEQVAGDSHMLDARSDVYALGVILYETLAGDLPYDLRARSLPESIRLIQTVEPSRLSTINTTFRGDIETIVAKALEKDRERRYASAAELAEDLRRYLANRPISARPPSSYYQFLKFTRRNRAAVIGAAAVLVALVIGFITTSIGMVRAREAEQLAKARQGEAEVARRESEAVNSFLNEMLINADPARNEGRELTMREALDLAAEQIDTFSRDSPTVTAAIHDTIGQTYQRLGQYPDGAKHLREALEIRRENLPPSDPRILQSMSRLAEVLYRGDFIEEAEPLVASALAELRRSDEPDTELLARLLSVKGKIEKRNSNHKQAIVDFRECVALFRELGKDPDGLAPALAELGALLSVEGEDQQAEAALREAFEIQSRKFGPKSAHVGGVLNSLAIALKRARRFEEAEPVYRESLEIQRNTFGSRHPATLSTIVNLGGFYAEQGKHEQAEPLFREAIPILREVHGSDGYQLGIGHARLAESLRAEVKLDEAEEESREAVRIFRAAMGSHPFTARGLSALGEILMDKGEYAEAIDALSEAATMYAESLGEDHPVYPDTLLILARAQRENGDLEGVEDTMQRAEKGMLADFETVLQQKPDDIALHKRVAKRMAQFYDGWGKPEEAKRMRQRYLQDEVTNANSNGASIAGAATD